MIWDMRIWKTAWRIKPTDANKRIVNWKIQSLYVVLKFQDLDAIANRAEDRARKASPGMLDFWKPGVFICRLPGYQHYRSEFHVIAMNEAR